LLLLSVVKSLASFSKCLFTGGGLS
jgi:hypothetical protein